MPNLSARERNRAKDEGGLLYLAMEDVPDSAFGADQQLRRRNDCARESNDDRSECRNFMRH
jgi:hypothetical protein